MGEESDSEMGQPDERTVGYGQNNRPSDGRTDGRQTGSLSVCQSASQPASRPGAGRTSGMPVLQGLASSSPAAIGTGGRTAVAPTRLAACTRRFDGGTSPRGNTAGTGCLSRARYTRCIAWQHARRLVINSRTRRTPGDQRPNYTGTR